MIDAKRLRSIVEQIESLEVEIRSRLEDRKAVYVRAKAHGFDSKVLKVLIRARRQDQAELDLFENCLSTYRRALEQ